MPFEKMTLGCLRSHLVIRKQTLFWKLMEQMITKSFAVPFFTYDCRMKCERSAYVMMNSFQTSDMSAGYLSSLCHHATSSALVKKWSNCLGLADYWDQFLYQFSFFGLKGGKMIKKEYAVSSVLYCQSPGGKGVRWELTVLHVAPH